MLRLLDDVVSFGSLGWAMWHSWRWPVPWEAWQVWLRAALVYGVLVIPVLLLGLWFRSIPGPVNAVLLVACNVAWVRTFEWMAGTRTR